jgi:peptidoglycan/LPS O-acetylase OafA/YrhL
MTTLTRHERDTSRLLPTSRLLSDPAGSDHVRTTSKSGEILPLTSLRFFAALYVVLFHTWDAFLPSLPGPRYWNDFLNLGYVGVSIFFILSGYILTVVYLPNRSVNRLDLHKFYIARFARIYPLYALSLISVGFFTWKDLAHNSPHFATTKLTIRYLANFGLLEAWYPALGTANVPAWSVSAEAFFYLVFPAIGLTLATKVKKPLRFGLFLWLSAIVISLSLLRVFHSPDGDLVLARFNPLLRLPEFLIGVCAARWQPRAIPKGMSWISVLIYLALIPLIAHLPMLLVSNGLLAPVFVALIISLGNLKGSFERFMSSPILVSLGHASYSLYLLHFPVLFWLTYLLSVKRTSELGSPWILPFSAPGRLMTYLVVTIAISIAGYYLVEKPARKYLIRRLQARNSRVTAPLISDPTNLPETSSST